MVTYRKEVLENLKNLNYASNQNRETAVRGFEGVQSAISEAAEQQALNAEKAREEAAYHAELQREEISAARDAVVGSIDKLSYDLGYKLDEVNRNLFNIDSTLQITKLGSIGWAICGFLNACFILTPVGLTIIAIGLLI